MPKKEKWEQVLFEIYSPWLRSEKPIPQYIIDNFKKEVENGIKHRTKRGLHRA